MIHVKPPFPHRGLSPLPASSPRCSKAIPTCPLATSWNQGHTNTHHSLALEKQLEPTAMPCLYSQNRAITSGSLQPHPRAPGASRADLVTHGRDGRVQPTGSPAWERGRVGRQSLRQGGTRKKIGWSEARQLHERHARKVTLCENVVKTCGYRDVRYTSERKAANEHTRATFRPFGLSYQSRSPGPALSAAKTRTQKETAGG